MALSFVTDASFTGGKTGLSGTLANTKRATPLFTEPALLNAST